MHAFAAIQALADFMESKRRAFPRFYFVSSSDLLEILSVSSKVTVGVAWPPGQPLVGIYPQPMPAALAAERRQPHQDHAAHVKMLPGGAFIPRQRCRTRKLSAQAAEAV